MTTEIKTEPNQQAAQTPAPAPTVDDSSTAVVPKSRLDGAISQASEWKAKAEEATAALARYQEAERKAAEDEAKKRGEYDKLVQERDKKIADLESATKAAELRARRESARALLVGKGMIDPLAQDGALARIAADGDFDAAAWVEKLAQDHPASFATQKAAPKPGVSGTVASTAGGGQVNKADLFSKDETARNAAWKAVMEAEANRLGKQ